MAVAAWCNSGAAWCRACACCGGKHVGKQWRWDWSCPIAQPRLRAMEHRHGRRVVGPSDEGVWSLTARSSFQDPGASFDVNDQDPDPQPRYTQMNDNR